MNLRVVPVGGLVVSLVGNPWGRSLPGLSRTTSGMKPSENRSLVVVLVSMKMSLALHTRKDIL